jgi:isoleucyl-tRNA synthetase
VLGYEKMLDEHGHEMHGSWGNMIEAEEAFARMGADVMRWQFCTQPPDRNLLFGFGPANEIKGELLTLWNSVRVLVLYANVAGWQPRWGSVSPSRPLDRWLVARTRQLAAEAERGYDAYLAGEVVRAYESFVEDLSNWYIRRTRRRFWDGDSDALAALWHALVQSTRVIAPVLPFLAEHLWQRLVRDHAEGAPDSVFLAGWPEEAAADDGLLAEMAEVRRVVELARQARATSGLKLRQPLRRLAVAGAPLAERHADEIRDELRVKDVAFGEVEATELRVNPNLPVLGPKLGGDLGSVRAALQAGEFEELPGGRFRAAGHELGPDEVLVERTGREGWAVASEDGVTVALDTALDAELELEGRVLDLIHELNSMRRDAGLELTDRIVVTLPQSHADLLAHEDWIKREVLATEIRLDGGIAIAKA